MPGPGHYLKGSTCAPFLGMGTGGRALNWRRTTWLLLGHQGVWTTCFLVPGHRALERAPSLNRAIVTHFARCWNVYISMDLILPYTLYSFEYSVFLLGHQNLIGWFSKRTGTSDGDSTCIQNPHEKLGGENHRLMFQLWFSKQMMHAVPISFKNSNQWPFPLPFQLAYYCCGASSNIIRI